MSSRPCPTSCDTFVYLPQEGSSLPACFGKNSDRPSNEEHLVVHLPRVSQAEAKVKCTYIEIPQVAETLAVVLSKPRWMWGCEIGANEFGVVGGNEAVDTRASSELGAEPRLLGMDLLRLSLERSQTAREAMQTCAGLLEAHGQGGGCAEDDPGWTYENGFIFADSSEAFVLETAGTSWWVAERVLRGSRRNISNGISIRSNIFAIHPGLKEHCKSKGWWDGQEPFDFKAVMTGRASTAALEPRGREAAGARMLEALAGAAEAPRCSPNDLVRQMAAILRDERSGICFRDLHGFNSTGSQVSLLEGQAGLHFFTCCSDPLLAAYKRFDFREASKDMALGPLSLQLWQLRRKLALQREPPYPGLEEFLGLLEQKAMDGTGSIVDLLQEELAMLQQLLPS